MTLTGSTNTLADPVIEAWRNNQVAQMTAQYKSLLLPERLGSLQTALEAAVAAQRGMRVRVIAFPGTPFSSPHQCSVFLRGDAPLTARLFTPVLVDAQTAKVTDNCALPWYVTAL